MAPEVKTGKPDTTARLSQDAAIVLGLASTALRYAISREDAAERWLRVLRLHGQVGCALQALGVGEAPLETVASPCPDSRDPVSADARVTEVGRRARELTRARAGRVVSTVDVLFALFGVYGSALDRALYVRGASRDELLELLGARGALV